MSSTSLIYILQMMPTIAEDYLGVKWKHFLLSAKNVNRNLDNFGFWIPFNAVDTRPIRQLNALIGEANTSNT
jgi:hypothetical protein